MRDNRDRVRGCNVVLREGEPFEKAMRRFKKKVQDSGLLQELRDRESYEKPTITRKRKKSAAKMRWKKKLQSQKLPPKLF